jgi:imidazolonepropionase
VQGIRFCLKRPARFTSSIVHRQPVVAVVHQPVRGTTEDFDVNLLVKNIGQLVTVRSNGKRTKNGADMRDLGVISDAWVLCENGKVAGLGPMSEWKRTVPEGFPELDARGRVVLPGFVDSHTHAMFVGDRALEFSMRSSGATYQEIAEKGGGILNTVKSVRAAGKKDLKRMAASVLADMLKHGTTTVEIKSGYGLDVASEIKMLEAIQELKNEEMIDVVATFLGAHAVPPEYKDDPSAYVGLVVNEMLTYVGKKKLAVFCDVFCEKGYFGLEESERILEEGKKHGLMPKVHADELSPLGGAELAARVGAVSADHLEHVNNNGIAALKSSTVVATLLPGVSFFLNHGYAPARRLIDAGIAVAIASDFNPGSCMSFSMPLMMTIACTHMSMTPEEAITASTLNAAAALNMSAELGSIEIGKKADLIVADIPDYRHLAYHFGKNHIMTTIKNGTLLEF